MSYNKIRLEHLKEKNRIKYLKQKFIKDIRSLYGINIEEANIVDYEQGIKFYNLIAEQVNNQKLIASKEKYSCDNRKIDEIFTHLLKKYNIDETETGITYLNFDGVFMFPNMFWKYMNYKFAIEIKVFEILSAFKVSIDSKLEECILFVIDKKIISLLKQFDEYDKEEIIIKVWDLT